MAEPNAFAEFLRARRERVTPAEVGLPDSGRRRTPGLRREEVAALAGVSIDYLIRLEQGRDTNPSPAVMVALADTLRIHGDERAHFFKLGHIASSPEMCKEVPSSPSRSVADTVQQLLDRLGPTPAFVIDPIYELLAWNATWERLVRPIGLLDDVAGANLARFTFLHDAAPAAYPDWDATADEQAYALRGAAAYLPDDPSCAQLVADLLEVPAFASRWSAHAVTEKRRRTKRVVHPEVGELRLAHEVLSVPDEAEQRLVVWLPADDATDDAIRQATHGTAGLRAV